MGLAQGFCKEFLVWKSLKHPNVLPLLGVVMTKVQFTMVSEWMMNGNINQFVAEHWDVNGFELVSFPLELPLPSLVVDNYAMLVVGRCCNGLDLYARSGDGPWQSQGSASLKAAATSLHLPALICWANILVDQDCHARLADFGLLRILLSGPTV